MKASKETARYRGHPNGLAQCSACTMWRPANGCTAVDGDISPRGWCSYFESVAAALKKAERQTDRNPSEAAKEAGNYAKGKLTVHGLPITIENPKGSKREGVDKGGKPWSVTMPASYGYIRNSLGRDGDHVDVYLGPDHKSQKAYIVDQVDAGSKRFDEHKVLLSYPSKAAALADYKAAFSDGKGAVRIGGVKETTVAKFRDWIKDGATTQPAARQAFATGGRVDDARMRIARQIAEAYIRAGYTPTQAAAIAGNMAWEGGGRTDLVNPGDNWKNSPRSPHSIGIGQWNDRAPALIEYARKQGIDLPRGDYRDVNYMREVARRIPLETQVGFAIQEKSGPEGRANAMIKASPDDLYTATRGAISYHRPAGWTWSAPERGHGFAGRMGIARSVLADIGRNPVAPGPAVAEAPRGSWQWPVTRGSMAFGAPRTELPAPMAAGLRDVPPVPVERPPVRPSVPAFDARSFFDSLDRSSYQSGGTVMPQKPAQGGLAALLATAQRYGRAHGGRIGYNVGGAPDPSSAGIPDWIAQLFANQGGAANAGDGSAPMGFQQMAGPMGQTPGGGAGAPPNVGPPTAGMPTPQEMWQRMVPQGGPAFQAAPTGDGPGGFMPMPGGGPMGQRAYGGPVGYAEGGAPWAGGNPDALETAERIREPGRGTLAPIYDWLGSAASAVNADLNRDQHPLDAVLDPSARKFLGGLGTAYGLEAPASAAKVLSKGIDYARGRPEATDVNTADVVNTAMIASPLGKAMTYAPKATGALAGLGALALPADASPPQAAEGSVLDRLIEQRKALMDQRAKDQAERDLQTRGDPKRGIKPGIGKDHKGATEGMARIDEQIVKIDRMIETELAAVQKRKYDESPEGVLAAEKAKKAFEEQQAEKERGRPVRERLLPGFLQDAVIPAATYAGYKLTKGIVGKQNAEHQGAINRFLEAQGANDVPAMALAQAQLQKLNNPGFWSSLGQGTKTALSALLPAEIRLGEAAIDLSKGPETRAFKEQSERLHDPYLLAADVGLPLLSSGLAYGAGSKMAKPYVERSLGKAIADNPNPYSGSGPLAAGYGRALELSESLGRLRQTGPAAPTPAATPLRSSAVEEATVVPPTIAAPAAPALAPPPASAAVPSPMLTKPLPSPANEDAIPKLPKGHRWVEAGKGSKVQDTEGNWTKMPKTPKPKTKPEPLTKGKSSKSGTKPEDGEFKRGGLVSRALEVARRYATGGRVLVGPVVGNTGGRTDALPVDVAAGSFVIPADCVAHLGEGNNANGQLKLEKSFGKRSRAQGGVVPIKISDGEFVISPEAVAKVGGGDIDAGHRALDALVRRIRADHIKTLQTLPGPATD